LKNIAGTRGFSCRNSLECKRLTRLMLRLIFSISFGDVADGKLVDACA
jgi:hypothetical protein